MAHATTIKGRHSELLAQTALLANGWAVAEPIAPEPYDLVAKDPFSGEWMRIQIKSARRRDDRKGEVVVYSRKNNGDVYTEKDCDLIIGVLDGEVYMFPVRNLSEYWCGADKLAEKWTRLDTTLVSGIGVTKNEVEAV